MAYEEQATLTERHDKMYKMHGDFDQSFDRHEKRTDELTHVEEPPPPPKSFPMLHIIVDCPRCTVILGREDRWVARAERPEFKRIGAKARVAVIQGAPGEGWTSSATGSCITVPREGERGSKNESEFGTRYDEHDHRGVSISNR